MAHYQMIPLYMTGYILGNEENSRKSYLQGVKAFTNFIGLSPENYLKKQKKKKRMESNIDQGKSKKYLSSFREHLESQSLAPKQLKTELLT